MNPPSSEVKPNLPPEAPAELEMPSPPEVTQLETPIPVAPPPAAETASAPVAGPEIDLGPVVATPETPSDISPQVKQQIARILTAEPGDPRGLAALAEKAYPDKST